MKKTIAALLLVMCVFISACTAGTTEKEENQNTEDVEITEGLTKEERTAFFNATKEYILYGQEEIPQANRLLWAPSFLDEVDFEKVYDNYLGKDGKADDAEAFAIFLTENAEAPVNWKELFENDLYENYSEKAERYEDLGNGLYQVYVMINDEEVAYVVVNSATGWYHG